MKEPQIILLNTPCNAFYAYFKEKDSSDDPININPLAMACDTRHFESTEEFHKAIADCKYVFLSEYMWKIKDDKWVLHTRYTAIRNHLKTFGDYIGTEFRPEVHEAINKYVKEKMNENN